MKFQAETFEEIAKISQEHGRKMFEAKDEEHLEAMQAMSEMMNDPEAMHTWMAARKAEFDALPHS